MDDEARDVKAGGRPSFLQRFIFNEFFKAALLPLLLVQIALLGIYFVVTARYQREAARVLESESTGHMQKTASDMAATVGQRLKNVSTLAALLQHETQHVFDSQAKYAENSTRESFGFAPNGVYYKKNDDGGSSVFYSTRAKVGPVEMRKAAMTQVLDQPFKDIFESNHDLVAVYLNTHDSMNRYYPFIDNVPEQFPPDMDIPEFNFYYLADTSHDPTREPVWTDAYLDPAGKGWMMSCVAPIYIGEYLEGVVGLDITINNFQEVLANSGQAVEANPFLVDGNGTIMVIPEWASNVLKIKELNDHVYERAVAQDTFKPREFNLLAMPGLKSDIPLDKFIREETGITGLKAGGREYILAQATVGATGWKLMLLADKKRLLAPLTRLEDGSQVVGYGAAGLTTAFYVAFFLYLLWVSGRMSATIAAPVRKVAEASRNILDGNYQVRVEDSGIAEMDELSGNFAAMSESLNRLHNDLKTSYDKLEDYNKNLQDMVEERTADLTMANAKLLDEIRERETTKKRLEDQYRFIQMLIDSIPNPIFCKDAQHHYTLCNKAFESFTGFTKDKITGKTVLDVLPPALAKANFEADVGLLAAPSTVINEFEMEIPGYGFRNVMSHKASFTDSEGRPAGIVGVMTDVTDFKRAEETARENEEILRLILNGIRAGIIIMDPRTLTVQDMNANAEAMFGLPREEYLGLSYAAMGWREEDGRSIGEDYPAMVGEGFREMRVNRRDGTVIPVFKTTLAATHAGKMLLYIIVFDISERKALERRLTHSQKLESIGQLAAGIAHEINTPIQYVGDNLFFLSSSFTDLTAMTTALLKAMDSCQCDYSEELKAKVDRDKLSFLMEEVPRAVEQSQEGVDRVATIVRAMKKFSHMGGEQKVPTDINAAIENTVIIAKNEWKYVSEVRTELDPDLPQVFCVPGDINQVILNIVVNAAHAIGDVYKTTQTQGLITIGTKQDGDFVDIRISDTGTGIPEANRHKIFDPFFTTKEVGKGTGQGLAIAYDVIVNKHGGGLDFETEMGRGTTFIIRLPIGGSVEESGSAGA